jgi:hypothetical protein
MLWRFPHSTTHLSAFNQSFRLIHAQTSIHLCIRHFPLGGPFIFINFLLSNIFIISGWERVNIWNLVGATVLNVILNLRLIPLFGAIGEVWATLFCGAGLIAALTFKLKNCLNRCCPEGLVLKYREDQSEYLVVFAVNDLSIKLNERLRVRSVTC